MAFMIAAYLVIWICSFAFIISMVRRQDSLRKDISALKELLKEKPARR